MNPGQFKESMSTLSACYPAADIGKETLEIYWIKFRNTDYGKFKKACNKAIEQSDYFPSIHRIIENMGNNISFGEVMDGLYKVISIPVGKSFSKRDLNPIVVNILDELGGKQRISMLSDENLQKQVRMKYKYAVEDEIFRISKREKSIELPKLM